MRSFLPFFQANRTRRVRYGHPAGFAWEFDCAHSPLCFTRLYGHSLTELVRSQALIGSRPVAYNTPVYILVQMWRSERCTNGYSLSASRTISLFVFFCFFIFILTSVPMVTNRRCVQWPYRESRKDVDAEAISKSPSLFCGLASSLRTVFSASAFFFSLH